MPECYPMPDGMEQDQTAGFSHSLISLISRFPDDSIFLPLPYYSLPCSSSLQVFSPPTPSPQAPKPPGPPAPRLDNASWNNKGPVISVTISSLLRMLRMLLINPTPIIHMYYYIPPAQSKRIRNLLLFLILILILICILIILQNDLPIDSIVVHDDTIMG